MRVQVEENLHGARPNCIAWRTVHVIGFGRDVDPGDSNLKMIVCLEVRVYSPDECRMHIVSSGRHGFDETIGVVTVLRESSGNRSSKTGRVWMEGIDATWPSLRMSCIVRCTTSWSPASESAFVNTTLVFVCVRRCATASGELRGETGNTINPARSPPNIEQKYVMESAK